MKSLMAFLLALLFNPLTFQTRIPKLIAMIKEKSNNHCSSAATLSTMRRWDPLQLGGRTSRSRPAPARRKQLRLVEALEAMSEKEALDMKAALESKGETNFQVCTLGKDVVITKKMVSISMEKKMEHQRVFTPSVVEPSFGIGRIIYCLFEHSFYTRPSKSEEEQLNVFRFPPIVAPIKCTVFPLVKIPELDAAAKVLAKELTAAGISHIIDTTAISIGRRYARTDEIGVPFAVTVDSATEVTIRERDSKQQVRVGIDEVASVVKQLTEGHSTWTDVEFKYPSHLGPQGDQE